MIDKGKDIFLVTIIIQLFGGIYIYVYTHTHTHTWKKEFLSHMHDFKLNVHAIVSIHTLQEYLAIIV